jgi:mannose-6-phosphate isomerase-like protein (cupin superfamily)/predicted  nucleic acid-binding Zn-ribbon protein
MRKVTDFLARAGVSSTPETLVALTGKPQNSNRPDDTGKSTFANIGERIGGDNEALRHLLIDTGLQFGALDELKETFGKLVDPLHNLLSTLEQAKFDNASLRGALTELRSNHETLRSEFEGLEKKSSELEGDNHRLTRELTAAQQSTQELEGDKTKLTNEIATMRVALANLEKQLGEETNSGRSLSDEKRLFLERADTADKRIIESEAAANLAREKLSLLENEKDSLQTALDQTLTQSSRTSRRLAEIENALSEARARLQQIEHNLAAVEDERKKLSAALDEANERRQSEVYALTLKLDAMRSRSTAAEKLLAEMRQSLVARTEEIRGEQIILSRYSDGEREFYAAKYTYAAGGKTRRGWLCIQGGDVIGEIADEVSNVSSGLFSTARLPVSPSDVAPDGTDVRTLLQVSGGSFAHFELGPGKISNAVTHRTVEEIWYFLSGRGEMWRKQADREEIVPVEAGVCVTIPLGTRFQFRSYGYEPLVVVVVTLPPWPGGDEAYQVDGKWKPTVTKRNPD